MIWAVRRPMSWMGWRTVVRPGVMCEQISRSSPLFRFEGFRDRLGAAGLQVRPVPQAEHYRREEGAKAMARYLAATPPEARVEALFCENDVLALGALDTLRSHGAAGQIAVVGFDDIDLAATPGYDLTTYRQPDEALIAEAIRRLTTQEATNPRFLAPGTLVLRSSHLRRP